MIARVALIAFLVGSVTASTMERVVRAQGPAAVLEGLSVEEREALPYLWRVWARPEQLAPEGDWRTWLIMAGRGFGKTRPGAEWIRSRAMSGQSPRLHLVGRTAADVRDVMVEGESGILAIHPKSERPRYEPSKRRLTWPNGCVGTTFSAEEPDSLRGPQCSDAWGDEVASWRYPDAWDQLMFGLRLGQDPRVVVSTTPRPVRIIRDLLADSTTRLSRGSSYDNRANLAPAFFEQILKRYEGTRLGQQEIHGALLDGVPGALWSRGSIERYRVAKVRELRRVVIAVDPATTSTEHSDMTGIVVAGLGFDDHVYVLADLSVRASPLIWARLVAQAFNRWDADTVVAEINAGNDLVRSVLLAVTPNLPVRTIRASRGKGLRAEPVAALAEQGRVHHTQRPACLAVIDHDTGGITWRDASPHDPHLADLEDQLCALTPDFDRAMGSPDRADALVYAVSELCPIVALPAAEARPAPLDPMDALLERMERRAAYADLDMDPGEET